jgi:hypothetical protein
MTNNGASTELEEIDYAASAEQAYDERDNFDELEPVEVDIDPNVRSVVSVRFNRGELSAIEAASRALGVPLSTFIRNAALQASAESQSNAGDLRDAVSAIQEAMELVSRHVPGAKGETPTKPGKKRKASRKAADGSGFVPRGYAVSTEANSNENAPESRDYRDPNGPIRLGARRRLAVDLLPFDHNVDSELLHSEGGK